MAPLIGITGRTSVGKATGQRATHLQESPVDYYFAEYGERLRAGGALTVELPVTDNPAAYVERLDGLVLTGGGDVDPELWGGQADAAFAVSRRRDDFEIALVHAALAGDVPVLAICRGIQVVNVALGGTLVPHLAWDEGDEHSRRREDRSAPVHEVEIVAGSILHRLYGERTVVNSFHHQAIDRPGTGMTVTGRSPDGTVEAAEVDNARVLGVQWHPEMLEAIAPVFTWLVHEAASAATSL